MVQGRRILKKIAFLIIAAFLLGILYNALFIEAFQTAGFRGFILKNTFYTSAFMGLTIALFENFVFRRTLVKLPFALALLLRTLGYLVIIIFTTVITKVAVVSIESQTNVLTIANSQYLADFLWSFDFLVSLPFYFFAFLFFNFTWQVSEMIGQSRFLAILVGRYYQPKEENLIFMFLDLKSSTTIAEKMGNIPYHKLLNRFFNDISEPINESQGTIYQYVGDEVVVYWHMDSGIDDANCIRCFFRISSAIEKNKDKYIQKYGFLPEFKAGLHGGLAVVGEIGVSKKDIVYHGDVLNTASRIQTKCNDYNRSFLISKTLLDKIELPHYCNAEKIGDALLKGKEETVEVFSIQLNEEA